MDSTNKVFIDPTKFTQADLPLIVLCDDLRGWLGWAIKAHTSGNYCHATGMIHPQKIATQGVLFQEIPLTDYLKDYEMIKFWKIKNLTDTERSLIFDAVNKRLKLPWWRRLYDLPGVLLGQNLHLKWLQIPGLEYCSEEVKADYIDTIARLKGTVPNEPSPSDLDRAFKANPDKFEAVGFWWAD